MRTQDVTFYHNTHKCNVIRFEMCRNAIVYLDKSKCLNVYVKEQDVFQRNASHKNTLTYAHKHTHAHAHISVRCQCKLQTNEQTQEPNTNVQCEKSG